MSVDVEVPLHLNSQKPPCHFPARVQKLKDEEHAAISRSIDASVEIKTIRESTQETRTVDKYIQKNNVNVTLVSVSINLVGLQGLLRDCLTKCGI